MRSGLIAFESGEVSTFDIGYTADTILMDLQLLGTKGVIEMDMFAQESVLYSDKTNKVSYQNWGSNIDAGLVTAFVRACQGDEASHKMLASGIDGLRAVEVVEAAYKSVATNQPVRVVRR